MASSGPPYAPLTQELGGDPSVIPDVPICAVLLVLVIIGAAAHMTIFQMNKKAGRKFIVNAMFFGFCKVRIITFIVRIAWACYSTNIRLGIAANCLGYTGVAVLYIANLIFAQRIIRAQHPHFGWTKLSSALFPACVVIIVVTILLIIVSVIQGFYTVNSNSKTHDIDRAILLYGDTMFAFMAILPAPLVGISCLIRQLPNIKHQKQIDKFGEGSIRMKVGICIFTAMILCLGASFRAGVNYITPLLLTSSTHPWYLSKAAYYVFNYAIEDIVIYGFLLVRVDKRFFVPDGAKGPFSYAGGFTFAGEAGNEKGRLGQRDSMRNLVGSSTTVGGNSNFYAQSSRYSKSSRVSWGGISRDDVRSAVGEDGVAEIPYPGDVGDDDVALEEFSGPRLEMGWDAKSGNWMLRPVSAGRPLSGHGPDAQGVDAAEHV